MDRLNNEAGEELFGLSEYWQRILFGQSLYETIIKLKIESARSEQDNNGIRKQRPCLMPALEIHCSSTDWPGLVAEYSPIFKAPVLVADGVIGFPSNMRHAVLRLLQR